MEVEGNITTLSFRCVHCGKINELKRNLCPRKNPKTFYTKEGTRNINNIINNKYSRGHLFQRVKKYVSEIPLGTKINVMKIEREFGNLSSSNGKIIRGMLDYLVCRGLLNKSEGYKKEGVMEIDDEGRGHIYEREDREVCKYLESKGKVGKLKSFCGYRHEERN